MPFAGTARRGIRTLETKGPSVLRVSTPVNLDLALEGLVRKVLREQPKQEDIYVFAAEYFETLVQVRDRAEEPNATPSEICPEQSDIEAHEMIKLATSFPKPAFMISSTTPAQTELCSVVDIDEINRGSEEIKSGVEIEDESQQNIEETANNQEVINGGNDEGIIETTVVDEGKEKLGDETTQDDQVEINNDEHDSSDIMQEEDNEETTNENSETIEEDSKVPDDNEDEKSQEGNIEEGNSSVNDKVTDEELPVQEQNTVDSGNDENVEVGEQQESTTDEISGNAEADEKEEIPEEKDKEVELSEDNEKSKNEGAENDTTDLKNISEEGDEAAVSGVDLEESDPSLNVKVDDENEAVKLEDSEIENTESEEGLTINEELIKAESGNHPTEPSKDIIESSALITSESGELEEGEEAQEETERDIIREFIEREKDFCTKGNSTISIETAEVHEVESAVAEEIDSSNLETSNKEEVDANVRPTEEEVASGNGLPTDEEGKAMIPIDEVSEPSEDHTGIIGGVHIDNDSDNEGVVLRKIAGVSGIIGGVSLLTNLEEERKDEMVTEKEENAEVAPNETLNIEDKLFGEKEDTNANESVTQELSRRKRDLSDQNMSNDAASIEGEKVNKEESSTGSKEDTKNGFPEESLSTEAEKLGTGAVPMADIPVEEDKIAEEATLVTGGKNSPENKKKSEPDATESFDMLKEPHEKIETEIMQSNIVPDEHAPDEETSLPTKTAALDDQKDKLEEPEQEPVNIKDSEGEKNGEKSSVQVPETAEAISEELQENNDDNSAPVDLKYNLNSEENVSDKNVDQTGKDNDLIVGGNEENGTEISDLKTLDIDEKVPSDVVDSPNDLNGKEPDTVEVSSNSTEKGTDEAHDEEVIDSPAEQKKLHLAEVSPDNKGDETDASQEKDEVLASDDAVSPVDLKELDPDTTEVSVDSKENGSDETQDKDLKMASGIVDSVAEQKELEPSTAEVYPDSIGDEDQNKDEKIVPSVVDSATEQNESKPETTEVNLSTKKDETDEAIHANDKANNEETIHDTGDTFESINVESRDKPKQEDHDLSSLAIPEIEEQTTTVQNSRAEVIHIAESAVNDIVKKVEVSSLETTNTADGEPSARSDLGEESSVLSRNGRSDEERTEEGTEEFESKEDSVELVRSRSSKDTESLDDENPFISAEVTTLIESQVSGNEDEEKDDKDVTEDKDDESDVIIPANASMGTIEEKEEGLLAANIAAVHAAIVIQKNFRRYLQRKKEVIQKGISEASSDNPDMNSENKGTLLDSTSSDSTLSSSATKIQNKRLEFARSTLETTTTSQSLTETAAQSTLKATGTTRQDAVDSEVWGTLERELDTAATTIQNSYRNYRSRKRLRREDAVQITTTASEDSESSPRWSGLLGTGELHDIVIPEGGLE